MNMRIKLYPYVGIFAQQERVNSSHMQQKNGYYLYDVQE